MEQRAFIKPCGTNPPQNIYVEFFFRYNGLQDFCSQVCVSVQIFLTPIKANSRAMIRVCI